MTGNAPRRRFRLVLADDRLDVLEEVRSLLEPEFDVLGAVAEGNALLHAVASLRPDAVISDIHMPGLGGIEAGVNILRQGLCAAVIVLTMHNEAHLVRKAVQAGIRGYVLKENASHELIPAIHAVLAGGSYFSSGVAAPAGIWK